ncbi:hypothetical protein [Mucilaginibacter celer]|uniref:3-oxoacyl-ACP synthase n=1 Tax=Mucilaginibacter celer TaxID=2305508 RepID=A0A494VR02_9SPHI|nr:hypothetical protein [Mucilaginibacter celer]AYL98027.1 hypothetical protein HYN43_023265 [Mucilaginibacter celer]
MNPQFYISSHCSINQNTVRYNNEVVFAAADNDIASFLLSVYQHLGVKYPKFYKMDNLAKLGWLAADVLLKDFDKTKYQPTDIGVVLTNAGSSLDADKRYFESTKDIASPALFVYTLPNIVIGEICIRHHFKGENAFYIFERFDADFIARYVSLLLETGQMQACICGWVEMTSTDYKAVLFLVEKHKKENSILFDAASIEEKFIAVGFNQR